MYMNLWVGWSRVESEEGLKVYVELGLLVEWGFLGVVVCIISIMCLSLKVEFFLLSRRKE